MLQLNFTKQKEDSQTRFEITGKPIKPDTASKLLIYTFCIKDENGIALLSSSGEIVPEINSDGDFEKIEEFSISGFDSLPSELVDEKKLVVEVNVNSFESKIVPLSEIKFGGPLDVPRLIAPASGHAPVNIIGQTSKYSVEGRGRTKRIDFLGSSAIFQNVSDRIVYVTYYVGTKKNTPVGNLGRIGLEQLLPNDTKCISLELYHETVGNALGFKILREEDLSRVLLYPFACVFFNYKTETLAAECGQP